MSNEHKTVAYEFFVHPDGEVEFISGPSLDAFEAFRCPTCDGYIPNNDQPGAYMGALSRRDNKTEICSACGTDEALEDYFFYGAGN